MGHSVLHLRSNFFTYRACINKSFCTSGGTERSAKVSTFLTLDVGNAHLILFRVPKNSQTSWFHDVAGTKHSAIRVLKKCKFCEIFFGSYLGLNQSYVWYGTEQEKLSRHSRISVNWMRKIKSGKIQVMFVCVFILISHSWKFLVQNSKRQQFQNNRSYSIPYYV